MKASSVSVVIPVHNGAHLIARALRSIDYQTAPVGEVIIVDDGSTDDLANVLRGVNFGGRLISQDRAGQGSALNLGLRMAAFEYVAFLDHDDEWDAGKTQWQLESIETCGADVVVGSVLNRRMSSDGVFADRDMGVARVLGASLMRIEAARAVGPFVEDARTHEIIDWWSRAGQTLRVHWDRRLALIRHIHGGNQTMRPEHQNRGDLLARIRDHRQRHA